MKKLLLILAFLIFLSGSLKLNAWCGMLYTNGDSWNAMTDEAKIGYVVGINDGIAFGLMTAATRAKDKKEEFKNLSFDYTLDKVGDFKQIKEGLDKYYSDYANKNIVGYVAYALVLKRIKGYPEDALQKEIEAARTGGTKLKKLTK